MSWSIIGGRCGAAGLMAGTALALSLSLPVQAQQRDRTDMPEQSAQAGERRIHFDIMAQPLPLALNAFGRRAGIQVTGAAAALSGIQAQAVSGDYTISDALTRLLVGTGVSFSFSDDRTVVLERVAVDGAMTLDPVTVEGAAFGRTVESAYGPVHGYVAKRAATATKTDALILETPQSISVVGAEEMETRNVQTLEDAIKYAPGVQLSYGATGDTRSSWYRMRGFPVTTTFYRDGMMVSGQNWQKIDSSVLERVEILRGPGSVIYGRGIPGGVVNTVTKRPGEIQAAEAAVEYGSFDWKRVEGDITGPLDEKKQWLYRITAAVQDSEGLNGTDHDKNNRKLFAPSLTWKPKDGTSITVAAIHQEDESRGWWPRMRYRTAAGTTDASKYLGEPNYDSYEQEQSHLSVLAEHAVDDSLKFGVSARYSRYDMDYRQAWPGSVQADGVTISRNNYAYKQDADVYTLDARVEKKLSFYDTRHTLLGGFDYLYQDRDNYFGSSTETSINIFNPVHGTHNSATATSPSDGDIRSPGLYAQDQIDVGNWVFLLGGRQDLAGSASGSGYQDTFTGRVGVAFKTGFGLVPYASYGESFEPQSGAGWGGSKFEPTTGRQYEVGVKYEPPGRNLMATVALFDLVKQNVLTTDPDATHICDGGQCSVQTGEVTSRGVEAGLTMGLAEGLNAVVSYTYNPMETTKSNVAGEVGRQLANQAIHTASLWTDYSIQDGPLGGLGFGGGLRFIGRTTSSAGNVSTSPQLLDEAMVRYDVEDWRLSLNVKNIFDREIEYSCSRGANAETCYLNEPLTITARLARKF